MKTQKVLALFLSCLIFGQISYAQVQTSAPVPVDEVRVARLVGLAKVWGAVKFFHPYLAYREIDWDKALVETLPKVNGAKTPQEYEAAVNQMLTVLGDQNTRAAIQRVEKRERAEEKISAENDSADENKKFVRSENGIVVINAAQMGAAFADDNSKLGQFIAAITQALPDAKGIVIDARGRGKITDLEQEIFDIFIRQALAAFVYTNIVLGSKRYRMQAEHTCLFFESVTDVTFIGMPTAGANGDISFMVMPGNLAVMFSGHDVRHADGRQLQRIGFQPTIRVAPTIRGMMEGRDEILERAIKYLGRR